MQSERDPFFQEKIQKARPARFQLALLLTKKTHIPSRPFHNNLDDFVSDWYDTELIEIYDPWISVIHGSGGSSAS